MPTTLPILPSTSAIPCSDRDAHLADSGSGFDAILDDAQVVATKAAPKTARTKADDATLATQTAALSQAITAQPLPTSMADVTPASPTPSAIVAATPLAVSTTNLRAAPTPSNVDALASRTTTSTKPIDPPPAPTPDSGAPSPKSAPTTPVPIHATPSPAAPASAPAPEALAPTNVPEPPAPNPIATTPPAPVATAVPTGALPTPKVMPPVEPRAQHAPRRGEKRAAAENGPGDVDRPHHPLGRKYIEPADDAANESPDAPPSAPVTPAQGANPTRPEQATPQEIARAAEDTPSDVHPAAAERSAIPNAPASEPAAIAPSPSSSAEITPAAGTPAPLQEFRSLRSEPALRLDPAADPAAPARLDRLLDDLRGELQTGKNEFRLRLNPAELGKLDVRIVAHGDGVVMHVVTERQDVADWIRTDLPLLHKAAERDGLHVLGVEVRTSVDLDQRSGGERGAPRDDDRRSGDVPFTRRGTHAATPRAHTTPRPDLSHGIDLLV